MNLRILSQRDVRAAIDMPQAIDAMREAFGALSAGNATVPLRLPMTTERGVTLFMPAYLGQSGALGAKIVSFYGGNAERGMPLLAGLVLVFDSATGFPVALMEGAYLTDLRTGAASGLATALLARRDASIVVLFGAGRQARTQLQAVRAVRPIQEVRIVDQSPDAARRFAAEIEGCVVIPMQDRRAAVHGAHVVVTATTSSTPVFSGEDVSPGTHVNGIGSFTSETREVDAHLVRRAKVVVDSRAAVLAEAGDLLIPIREGVFAPDGIHAEIGEIVNGTATCRTSPDEITFFKSVGNAAQDVTVASRIFDLAERQDLGTVVEL